jgi:hypothetical protein
MITQVSRFIRNTPVSFSLLAVFYLSKERGNHLEEAERDLPGSASKTAAIRNAASCRTVIMA